MKMKLKKTQTNQRSPGGGGGGVGGSELPFKEHIQLKTNQGQKAASGITRTHVCAAVSSTTPPTPIHQLGGTEEARRPSKTQLDSNWPRS